MVLPFDIIFIFRIHALNLGLRDYSTDRLQSNIFVFFLLLLVPTILFVLFIVSFLILAKQAPVLHFPHGTLDSHKAAHDFFSDAWVIANYFTKYLKVNFNAALVSFRVHIFLKIVVDNPEDLSAKNSVFVQVFVKMQQIKEV